AGEKELLRLGSAVGGATGHDAVQSVPDVGLVEPKPAVVVASVSGGLRPGRREGTCRRVRLPAVEPAAPPEGSLADVRRRGKPRGLAPGHVLTASRTIPGMAAGRAVEAFACSDTTSARGVPPRATGSPIIYLGRSKTPFLS